MVAWYWLIVAFVVGMIVTLGIGCMVAAGRCSEQEERWKGEV